MNVYMYMCVLVWRRRMWFAFCICATSLVFAYQLIRCECNFNYTRDAFAKLRNALHTFYSPLSLSLSLCLFGDRSGIYGWAGLRLHWMGAGAGLSGQAKWIRSSVGTGGNCTSSALFYILIVAAAVVVVVVVESVLVLPWLIAIILSTTSTSTSSSSTPSSFTHTSVSQWVVNVSKHDGGHVSAM